MKKKIHGPNYFKSFHSTVNQLYHLPPRSACKICKSTSPAFQCAQFLFQEKQPTTQTGKENPFPDEKPPQCGLSVWSNDAFLRMVVIDEWMDEME